MVEDYDGVIGIVFQRSNPIRYVLISNQGTGNITFPGGGKEDGETFSVQSLEREVKEETGLLPFEYKIIKTPIVHEFVYGPKKNERAGQTARQPVYLVETSRVDLKPEDLDSVIDGWYTAEEVIEKLTFLDSKELFQKAIHFL